MWKQIFDGSNIIKWGDNNDLENGVKVILSLSNICSKLVQNYYNNSNSLTLFGVKIIAINANNNVDVIAYFT